MTIASPPAITFESTAAIVKRQGDHSDTANKSARVPRSMAHCRLMAPMSNDTRLQYLNTSGCNDDVIRLITRAVAECLGKAAKPALTSAALQCAETKKGIEDLLDRWPEPQHFQMLSSKLNSLNEEQVSLSNAYAACQIYEMAATAVYLAIADGMTPVTTEEVSDAETMARDQAIADAGYTDEVARWPK